MRTVPSSVRKTAHPVYSPAGARHLLPATDRLETGRRVRLRGRGRDHE